MNQVGQASVAANKIVSLLTHPKTTKKETAFLSRHGGLPPL